MDAKEVLKQRMAYLDGQLAADKRLEFEAFLSANPDAAEALDGERKFHAFLGKACAAEKTSDIFRQKLSGCIQDFKAVPSQDTLEPTMESKGGKESAERSSFDDNEPALRPLTNASRASNNTEGRWWRPLAVAASVLVVVGAAFLFYSTRQCPYMNACAAANAEGISQHLVTSSDSNELLAYIRKNDVDIPALPQFSAIDLAPEGAGNTDFKNIGKRIPDGYYVKYTSNKKDALPLTLILHPWQGKEPLGRLFDTKEKVWKAEHNGFKVVCFRTPDGRLLCTAVSKRPMKQVLRMASNARSVFKK